MRLFIFFPITDVSSLMHEYVLFLRVMGLDCVALLVL